MRLCGGKRTTREHGRPPVRQPRTDSSLEGASAVVWPSALKRAGSARSTSCVVGLAWTWCVGARASARPRVGMTSMVTSSAVVIGAVAPSFAASRSSSTSSAPRLWAEHRETREGGGGGGGATSSVTLASTAAAAGEARSKASKDPSDSSDGGGLVVERRRDESVLEITGATKFGSRRTGATKRGDARTWAPADTGIGSRDAAGTGASTGGLGACARAGGSAITADGVASGDASHATRRRRGGSPVAATAAPEPGFAPAAALEPDPVTSSGCVRREGVPCAMPGGTGTGPPRTRSSLASVGRDGAGTGEDPRECAVDAGGVGSAASPRVAGSPVPLPSAPRLAEEGGTRTGPEVGRARRSAPAARAGGALRSAGVAVRGTAGCGRSLPSVSLIRESFSSPAAVRLVRLGPPSAARAGSRVEASASTEAPVVGRAPPPSARRSSAGSGEGSRGRGWRRWRSSSGRAESGRGMARRRARRTKFST